MAGASASPCSHTASWHTRGRARGAPARGGSAVARDPQAAAAPATPVAAARQRGARQNGEAVPLAAAGPGSHAQGRQAAPPRMALEPRPALAARGSLARWRRAVAAGSQRGSQRTGQRGAAPHCW